jgi:signal transduction histidine kinase
MTPINRIWAISRWRPWSTRLSYDLAGVLRKLRIGVRLRLAFVCILLLMMSTGIVGVWQFRALSGRVREVSLAERRATAVMQLNDSLLRLMNRLYRAAENDEGQRFEGEAKQLIEQFQAENSNAIDSLAQIPTENGRQKMILESLSEVLRSSPARVGTLIALARARDWVALHARLADQIDQSDIVGEQVMAEASSELVEARGRLSVDMERAERRIAQTLVVGSLVALLVAGALGILVTQSITRPLTVLDRGALAVAQGDFSVEIPDLGTDELARVGNAFNVMIQELAARYARESEARHITELLNATLRQTNEDLSVFAYSASHDLQEPLRGIVTYSQLLQRRYKDDLKPEAREFLEIVIASGLRMSQLIKDLLAYMRTAREEIQIVSPSSSQEAVAAAVANLQTSIQTNEAVVQCDHLPDVAVEPIHLQQLFQNLIGNAIKYRSDAPPLIRISATEQDGFWRFSVKDNGIGIDTQYCKQVFGLFKRVNAKSDSSGTGIGLAICQKIVERYGGKIWVESALKEGSDFQFTIPRKRV